MPRYLSSLALATAAALLVAGPGLAQTTYSGAGAAAGMAAADFAGAIGPSTVQDFEGFGEGELSPVWLYLSGTASLSNGFGVTSAYPYGGAAVSPANGYGAYPNGGVGGDPVFTFSGPIRAFGAYFVDVEETDFLVFNLVGGGTQSFALPVGGNGDVSFFGVDFGSNAVTGVTLDLTGDDAVLVDDVRIAANAGGIPEPATWALMMAGFGLAGAGMRARRRTADQPAKA